MTVNFTMEIKRRLIRLLADGDTAAEVAEELGCEPQHVVAIAKNHGYPDREKLAWAADIMEKNATDEPVASLRTTIPTTPPAGNAHNTGEIGALLNTAKAHPAKRIRTQADQIMDRLSKLRALIAEDAEKNAEKRQAEAARQAARAEVAALEQQLADAKAKLRKPASSRKTPTKPKAKGEHPCRDGCGATFGTPQGRSLHERRAHGPADEVA